MHQAHRGSLWLGSYSEDQCISYLKETPVWDPALCSVCQAFDGQALYCSAADAGMWGERGYGDGSTPYT